MFGTVLVVQAFVQIIALESTAAKVVNSSEPLYTLSAVPESVNHLTNLGNTLQCR